MPDVSLPGSIGVGRTLRSVSLLACSLLSGSALVVGDIADTAYTAAFRTDIVDTSVLSSDELQRVLQLQTYEAEAVFAYTSIGQQTGLSCRETTRWVPVLSERNGMTPEEVAMTQLKVKVIKAGGDAVRAPTCVHRSTIDWKDNCFASWTCTGEAIRVAQ
jgi:hypothetical protein